jgi:hypothetical protein
VLEANCDEPFPRLVQFVEEGRLGSGCARIDEKINKFPDNEDCIDQADDRGAAKLKPDVNLGCGSANSTRGL